MPDPPRDGDLRQVARDVTRLRAAAKNDFDQWGPTLGVTLCRYALGLVRAGQLVDAERAVREADGIVRRLESGQSDVPVDPGSRDESQIRQQALRVCRRAVDVMPPARRPFGDSALGIELRHYCEDTGDTEVLEEALSRGESAVRTIPKNDPGKAAAAAEYAETLMFVYHRRISTATTPDEFRRCGDALEGAMHQYGEALGRSQIPDKDQADPDGYRLLRPPMNQADRERRRYLWLWRQGEAMWLYSRHIERHRGDVPGYENRNSRGDLGNAIELLRQAAEAAPPDAPQLPEILYLAGIARLTRFDQTTNRDDLTRAIGDLGHAVAAASASDPRRLAYQADRDAALARVIAVGLPAADHRREPVQ